MPAKYIDRRGIKARQLAARAGVSVRTVQRATSKPRAQWLQEKADEREAMRAFHDDEGHSWSETADHFGLEMSTVRQRAFRARKERAREAEEKAKGPTLFDVEKWND